MRAKIIKYGLLFEVRDVFGRNIRTTKEYWLKIKTLKHQELRYGVIEVKKTLKSPEEVRRSVTDQTVLLFSKKVTKYDILIVAIKVLNSDGFLVTVYQTKKYTKKGELLWLRKQEE